MIDTNELEQGLAHFWGSEEFYRHPLFPIVFTEGVKYLADNAGAYWLLDLIGGAQFDTPVGQEEFQLWILSVEPDGSAVLKCDDGNHNIVYAHTLDWTDFPLPEIKLYFENHTIMLPSER